MSANDQGVERPSVERTPQSVAPDWWIYRGTGRPLHDINLAELLPAPPPWRRFRGASPAGPETVPQDDYEAERRLGAEFHLTEDDADPREIDMVNAALFLRRPLLVTGRPGSGKSALAYRIARELRLGRVLRWSITSSTTLQSGTYSYDAIGRAQAAATRYAAARRIEGSGSGEVVEEPPIRDSTRLGPLGTAFLPAGTPHVLLIDELDKSDGDLLNDLLSIFEDAEFGIPELERIRPHTPEVRVFTSELGPRWLRWWAHLVTGAHQARVVVKLIRELFLPDTGPGNIVELITAGPLRYHSRTRSAVSTVDVRMFDVAESIREILLEGVRHTAARGVARRGRRGKVPDGHRRRSSSRRRVRRHLVDPVQAPLGDPVWLRRPGPRDQSLQPREDRAREVGN